MRGGTALGEQSALQVAPLANGEDGAEGVAVDLEAVLIRVLNFEETEGALGAEGAMRNWKRGW